MVINKKTFIHIDCGGFMCWLEDRASELYHFTKVIISACNSKKTNVQISN